MSDFLNVETEISDAITTLSIEARRFKKVSNNETLDILEKMQSRFLTRKANHWWWEHFSGSRYALRLRDDMAYKRLDSLTPVSDQPLFFVAQERLADNWGFIIYLVENIDLIQNVISECSGFEYYVVPKNLDWLICENHHGVLIGISEAVVKQFQQYVILHPDEILEAREVLP